MFSQAPLTELPQPVSFVPSTVALTQISSRMAPLHNGDRQHHLPDSKSPTSTRSNVYRPQRLDAAEAYSTIPTVPGKHSSEFRLQSFMSNAAMNQAQGGGSCPT